MYNFVPMPQSAAAEWYRIKAEADTDEASVHIFDSIGWFGVEARALVKELDGIKAETIHVHINSPGGDVFDGVAIHNALKRHSAKVVVHIDGLAASIASVIALAGDEVRMAENAMFMIHNPWMVAIGDASEFRKAADTLDKIRGTILTTYVNGSNMDEGDIIAAMDAETWYSASDALEAGFINEIETFESDEDEKPSNKHDLSKFKNAPKPGDDSVVDPGPDIEMMRRRLQLAAAQ